MELSALIPCYNEQASIERTVAEIEQVIEGLDAEIIVVNDGSSDGSHTILQKLADDGRILLLRHPINRGYGTALKTGIRAATSNNIAIMDADGTYPIEKIPMMFERYKQENLDMIIGSRTGENVNYPLIKKIPKFFITKFAEYISGEKIIDINSGLRIFRKDVALQFFNIIPSGFSFTTTITMSMLSKGYFVDYEPIDYFEREGKSKIHPIKDTIGFFSLLIRIVMYFNPLRFFMPFVIMLGLISVGFITKDVLRLDLSSSSVLFPILTLITIFMALIADLIVTKFDQHIR